MTYSDLRVLESTTRAISRIVEWAANYSRQDFEEIISKSLIKAVRDVSAPQGSCTNSPLILTMLIKILAGTAKASHNYAGLLVSELDVFPHIIQSLSGKNLNDGSVLSSNANNSPENILAILSLASDLLPDLPKEGIWSLNVPLVEEYKNFDHAVLRLKAFNELFFKRYFSEIIPVLIQVFGLTVNSGIRRKCLECVAKAIWFTDKETLDKIDVLLIGKFVSDLIGLSQSFISSSNELEKETIEIKAFVAGGISIAHVLLKKYEDRFRRIFTREGVLTQIKNLSQSLKEISENAEEIPPQEEPSGGRNVEDMIMNIVQDLNEMDDQINTQEHAPSEDENENESVDNPLRDSHMARMMSNMRTAFESIRRDDSNTKTSSNRKNIRSISSDRYTSIQVLKWMKAVSETIISLLDGQSGKNDELTDSLLKINDAFLGKIPFFEELQTFAELLLGDNSTTGLTGFELLENGLINSLWSFLTCEAEADILLKSEYQDPLKVRIQHFYAVFFNGPSISNEAVFVEKAFSCLVNRLQECLSRSESLILATAIPQENSNASVLTLIGTLTGMGGLPRDFNSPLLQLAKQIRVKLISDNPQKNSPAIVVRIHAVATFKALEEYLKTRILEDDKFNNENEVEDVLDDFEGLDEEFDEDDVEPMDEDGVI